MISDVVGYPTQRFSLSVQRFGDAGECAAVAEPIVMPVGLLFPDRAQFVVRAGLVAPSPIELLAQPFNLGATFSPPPRALPVEDALYGRLHLSEGVAAVAREHHCERRDSSAPDRGSCRGARAEPAGRGW